MPCTKMVLAALAGLRTTSLLTPHIILLVPEWLYELWRVRQTYIGQLELLAAISFYYSMPDLVRHRDVVHWVDNTSALYSLFNGYSSQPDNARMINYFQLFCMMFDVRVYWEYVASKANIADLPSRRDFLLLLSLGAVYVARFAFVA